MAGFAGRDTGYFTAANTKKGNTGLVFNNCTLTVDESYGEGSTVSLGRPWQTEIYTETARDEEGNTVDVTYHDDVHFVEINSKDTSGAYLNPDDYKNIVLGAMTLTDDAQGTVDELLGQMGFGAGVGNWNPTFTDYSGTKPQDIPGTGDGTGEGAGTVGNGNGNGASNGAGGNTAAGNGAVRTGDTSNILPWIAILLVSAAGVVFALRRKIAGKH